VNIRDRIKELRRVPADQLQPNPKNWRKHPESQANALRGVLAEVGIASAVLARETPEGGLMLIDGHLRTETLHNAEIPVLVLDVTEEEADKILATFDPLGAMAESDADALRALLEDVETGSQELADMLTALAEDAGILDGEDAAEIVEDEVPEPPVDPITKPGDLWILGEHRLLCGDSTKAEDVERLMNGAKADLLLTDPPYGIGIAANPVRQKHERKDWDAKPVEPSRFIDQCKNAIVWGGNYFDLRPGKGFFVWDKKQPEDFTLAMCEMAWTNIDTPAKMFRKSVTSYAKEHPTQKPVELMAWCMGWREGDVFDPFLGSGTTLIAAEQLGRKCYGMEISPQYCDVIVKRWETLTGRQAERRESDDQASR
jgi:site-specific DNA-methyltransferase (adenine-specific)/modification methylase